MNGLSNDMPYVEDETGFITPTEAEQAATVVPHFPNWFLNCQEYSTRMEDHSYHCNTKGSFVFHKGIDPKLPKGLYCCIDLHTAGKSYLNTELITERDAVGCERPCLRVLLPDSVNTLGKIRRIASTSTKDTDTDLLPHIVSNLGTGDIILVSVCGDEDWTDENRPRFFSTLLSKEKVLKSIAVKVYICVMGEPVNS